MLLSNKKLFLIAVLSIYLSTLALDELDKKSRREVGAMFGNNTLLVIAHPDDESMFFGPTILNIINNNQFVTILCLSSGESEGLSSVRTKELEKVSKFLGPSVKILQPSKKFIDNQYEGWDIYEIESEIEYAIKNAESKIDTVLTFDNYGVSGHIHHMSIHEAVKEPGGSISKLVKNIVILKSVSLLRKYFSFLESFHYYMITNLVNFLNPSHKTKQLLGQYYMVINLDRYYITRKALMLHQSQMVWFRLLYATFSRYMFINDLHFLQ